MNQLLAEYWYLLAIALVIGLVVAWYLFRSTRRTKVTGASRGDVLDEGAQKAQRNSALVDAPPAAARDPQPVSTPTGLGGSGGNLARLVNGAGERLLGVTANSLLQGRHGDRGMHVVRGGNGQSVEGSLLLQHDSPIRVAAGLGPLFGR